jgi:tyrosine-protein kinase Etk/Wzc
MSVNPAEFFSFVIPETKKKNTDTKQTVIKYLFHWPLFIIGLAIALTAVFFYLQIAKPVYVVKASLIIKDDKKDGETADASKPEDIGLTNPSEDVENEIEVLKSKRLVGEVVKDLQLWVTYKKKDGFLLSHELYKNSPVKLVSLFPAKKLNGETITIKIKDDKSFLLETAKGREIDFPYNASYKSSFGVWRLEPTENLSLYKDSVIKIILSDPDKTTIGYQNLLGVELVNKLATSIDLSVTDKVPQRGKDFLNCLLSNYDIATTIEKNKEAKSTLDFLDQRIASLTSELSASENGIENFKSSKGLTDLTSDSKINLENMQANDAKLNDVNVKLSVIDGIERYINSSENLAKAPAMVGFTDPALTNSIDKLAQLQLLHDKMAATLPETNPDFDPVNRQIETTKDAIKENVKNIKQSLESTRDELMSFNTTFKTSTKNIPVEERQYADIERQQTSKENLYTYLLQKREEISVKYASNLTNNRVVDQAYAEAPANYTSMAYLLALILGISLPALLIYGRNAFAYRITNLDEITGAIKTPVISELPYEKTKSLIAVKEDTLTPASEQLRALRVKLHYLNADKPKGRVTLLTSSVPGEGKSFVSVNLSIVSALADKKTILLELDMRKPRLAKSFGLTQKRPGISDYLKGTATAEDVIQPSGYIPNLDIIGSGSKINNPSEILGKEELNELILHLKDHYDDIIIDSPPVHLVPDALILCHLSDVTLYVIRQGFTGKAELDFINKLFDQNHFTNTHIVFNGVQRIKYGYGYRYDEGYYHTVRHRFFTYVFDDFKSRF